MIELIDVEKSYRTRFGRRPVAHAFTQAVADHLQDLVAPLGAEAVVDARKAVEVHHHHGAPAVVAQATGHRAEQALTEELAVGQAGEVIEVRQLAEDRKSVV